MSEWSLVNAAAVANSLARERGRTEARLLRFGSNGLFAIDDATVARISPASRDVQRGVRFAIAAAEAGLPVLAPLDSEVSLRDGMSVTLWPLRLESEAEVDYRWLGQTAALLHELAPELAEACGLNLERNELADTQLAKVGYRLDFLHERADFGEDIAALSSHFERIEATWADVDWHSLDVLHGDLYGGNVLGGQPALVIDFDQVVIGPRAWDHVPVDVQVRRFGLPKRCRADFIDGYGRSLTQEPGYELLVQLREIASVTWVAQLSILRPELRDEVRIRLRTFADGTMTPWTPR